jgi:hypothetical protein
MSAGLLVVGGHRPPLQFYGIRTVTHRPPSESGLAVALADAPDNFLRVGKEALPLDIGAMQLREVFHGTFNVA